MAKSDTLFKSAGVCTHTNGTVTVTKIRYGTDYVRRVKLLSTPGNVHVGEVKLNPVRVGLVELPQPMVKMDALNFILSHPDFQSAEDQALIQDEIAGRMPKPQRERKPRAEKAPRAARAKREVVVKATKPSLEGIRARGTKSRAAAAPAPLSTEAVMEIMDEVVAELQAQA